MARHLLIGNGATVAAIAAGGLATDTCVALQVESGLIMAADTGDDFADSNSFRVLQGTAGANIVSPWINGKNIISVSATPYAAPSAHTVTDTIANTADAAGTLELKFVRIGGESPAFFNISIPTTAVAHTAQDTIIKTAFEAATIPDWLNPVCNATAGATCIFSGALRGDVTQSGNVWEEDAAIIDLIIVGFDGGTQTHAASRTAGVTGSGDGNTIVQLEKDLQGVNYGYYNQIKLPNAPALTASAAGTYDMITIVATKDGSTTSAINGVDNLIHIDIALSVGDDIALDALQLVLNAYTASVGFAGVDAGL